MRLLEIAATATDGVLLYRGETGWGVRTVSVVRMCER